MTRRPTWSLAVVLALTAAVATALVPAARGATGDDIYQCVFEGETTELTPVTSLLGVILGQPNVGNGDYRFEGTDLGTAQGAAPTCVYVDGDNDSGNPVSVPQVVDTTIVSTGIFSNTFCGTGHATGDFFNAATGKGTTLTTPRGVAKLLYEIEFVGGVGTLVAGGTDGLGQGLTGSGVVDLMPPDGAPLQCTVQDLSQFRVRGSIVLISD